jgi:CRISPR/Cas system CMR subunit Cmr4 (Cas7 group RAMP superfamily)
MIDVTGARWAGPTSRKIRRRLVVEGELVFETPVHLGSGDSGDVVDLPVLRDALTGQPLLPGSALAGALRRSLQERTADDRVVSALFGAATDVEGGQSRLIVEDALAIAPGLEVRDGVRLDPKKRTAQDGGKFDLELWPAGTTFPLRCELLLDGASDDALLRAALATALGGLSDAERSIRFGVRKSRGFGQARVSRWRVSRYELQQAAGLLAWLAADEPALAERFPAETAEGEDVARLLGITPFPDQRAFLTVEATFGLVGSLLIRGSTGTDDLGPDFVSLASRRAGAPEPILSGTSLAGALRARADRIARTLARRGPAAEELVTAIFGSPAPGVAGSRSTQLHGSRLVVDEQVIFEGRTDLVQSRVAIDRFTGGAYPGALFSEQPVFARSATLVTMRLRLAQPQTHELGLLLLLLKDLWTGDLPLGGESAVGRGRLAGRRATIRWRASTRDDQWTIEANQGGLLVLPSGAALEAAVGDLAHYLNEPAQPGSEAS